jgi:hypothetical protein
VRFAAILLIGLVVVAGLAWIGSELHYRSCVDAAEARTPVVVVKKPGNPFGARGLEENSGAGDETVRGQAARRRAVDACSRLPF